MNAGTRQTGSSERSVANSTTMTKIHVKYLRNHAPKTVNTAYMLLNVIVIVIIYFHCQSLTIRDPSLLLTQFCSQLKDLTKLEAKRDRFSLVNALILKVILFYFNALFCVERHLSLGCLVSAEGLDGGLDCMSALLNYVALHG